MTIKSQAIFLDKIRKANPLKRDFNKVMSKKKGWIDLNGRWINIKAELTKEKIAKIDAYYRQFNELIRIKSKEIGY